MSLKRKPLHHDRNVLFDKDMEVGGLSAIPVKDATTIRRSELTDIAVAESKHHPVVSIFEAGPLGGLITDPRDGTSSAGRSALLAEGPVASRRLESGAQQHGRSPRQGGLSYRQDAPHRLHNLDLEAISLLITLY